MQELQNEDMALNPDYLKTHTPEEIDEMPWESLETAITLWIQHFKLAVKAVLVSEKSKQVLGGIMEGLICSLGSAKPLPGKLKPGFSEVFMANGGLLGRNSERCGVKEWRVKW
ncbi:hypothetical protein ACFX2C_018185 [Malus domestica]